MKKTFSILALVPLLFSCHPTQEEGIDRHALVHRNHVRIHEPDSLDALTVGNGDFAFTVDITGLQTFPEYHLGGIPLGTFSNWCWHSDPNSEGYSPSQCFKYFQVGDRQVPYIHDSGREGDSEAARAAAYLRQNPHRMNMGMIGLKILDENGELIGPEDIENPDQQLNLWEGIINSRFEIDGVPVRVLTTCHPEQDLVACRISSPLLTSGRLSVELRFPEADRGWKNQALWGNGENHESEIRIQDRRRTIIAHSQDETRYLAAWNHATGTVGKSGSHRYELMGDDGDSVLSFTCQFSELEDELNPNPDFDGVRNLAAHDWKDFWMSGGAVDFSSCTDERAAELERRVVLSRYLMRVNCSGTLPPQETGLTYNSWFGKMHLEMHWWHGVHFALWQNEDILEKQMYFYRDIEERARELAAIQGYHGLRWPKMIGPEGFTSPSNVGNYLIWQQPHFIYIAELLYQTSADKEHILNEFNELVEGTATFMASYPTYEKEKDRYVLGPALIPAQETFHAETTINPAFELTYWHWALGTAILWKERQGKDIPAKWTEVREKLSALPVLDSAYLFTEDGTDSYTNKEYISDHPAVLGSLGMLPQTELVDRRIMRNTFDKIVERWNWPRTWGWDYPLVAMNAAELGLAGEAVRFLMLDVQKNTYLPNGHNFQDGRLTLYLPGNGGLLTAVARMCTKDQFPKDGSWEVKWENLNDF